MKPYDLVVIGSGPAGEKGAAQSAFFGKRVALVEREFWVGGACVNTGTIPSKTLRESALHLSGFRRRELYGVDVLMKPNISVADFMRRKNQVVEREWDQIEGNLLRHGIHRYRGTATFLSPNELAVKGSETDVVLTGSVFLIATGSAPHHPPDVPIDHKAIYDSDSILQIDHIPESLAVVGAGVIGCEYASIFAALGVRVYLIDGRRDLLPHVDRQISTILREHFRDRLDIELHLGVDVVQLVPNGSSVRVELAGGKVITPEKVLYAAGRQSNTAELNLAAAGVQTGKRGVIAVNERYQTNVPHIYAAGDVIGFPALASTSMEQARVAMVHAFDLKYKTKLATLLPYAIYTIPEIAMIGLTEQECDKQGLTYEVGRAWYRNNARGQIIGDTDGLIKIIFEPDTLKIHGIHILGENASELLHVGMMAMHFGGTINSFIECVFNYPTLGDAYKYAAYDGLITIRRKSLAAKEGPVQSKSISEIIEGKPLIHVRVDENVRTVAKHMAESSVGAVAVLEGGKLVGMFTERDLMTRVIARDLDPDSTDIAMVMTRDVAVASPEENVESAVHKMQSLNCRHLPVVDEGKLVGMISLRDLMQVDSQITHARVDLLSELVTYSPDYES